MCSLYLLQKIENQRDSDNKNIVFKKIQTYYVIFSFSTQIGNNGGLINVTLQMRNTMKRTENLNCLDSDDNKQSHLNPSTN